VSVLRAFRLTTQENSSGTSAAEHQQREISHGSSSAGREGRREEKQRDREDQLTVCLMGVKLQPAHTPKN